jgi:hypothetical protein
MLSLLDHQLNRYGLPCNHNNDKKKRQLDIASFELACPASRPILMSSAAVMEKEDMAMRCGISTDYKRLARWHIKSEAGG